jgi:EAL domain-containing protein (putative c-di-GMP-specific phosphodiesterase class I)
LALELRQSLAHSICIEGKQFHLTLSIGINHHPLQGAEGETLLAKSIIDLAHNLRLGVIAEGVENQQQLTIIETLGAEEIQGFYFSKPKPNIEIEAEYFIKPNAIITDS